MCTPDWRKCTAKPITRTRAAIESAEEKRIRPDRATALRRKYLDTLRFQQQAADALARLSHSPETPEYHALLGLVYRMQHRDVQSVEEFRRALALAPHSLNLKLKLATSLAVAKDCNRASPLLQEVLQTAPRSTEARHVWGECLVDQHRDHEAILALKAVLQEDPHLLPAESALGRAYLHTGAYRDAVIHLGRAIVLGDASTFYQLAETYAKLGDPKHSAEHLAQYKAHTHQVQASKPLSEITPP